MLKIHTKRFDWKTNTSTRSRGSVKGTKCGNSVTFGTFLQQWFGLGMMKHLMRQANQNQSAESEPGRKVSESEEQKAERKGINGTAIALIAESITSTAARFL